MTLSINGNGDVLTLSSASMAAAVYTPAGTGAIATTVQAKLRESVSVLDFGADPAASAAANTVAIQAAINYVNSAGGGRVYVPAGTYEIATGGLAMKSNVTITGDGYASVLQGPDFIIGVHSGALPPSASAALTNCEISNLRVRCTYTGLAYQDTWCIYFFINNVNQTSPTVRGSNIRVINCYVENSGTTAVMFSGFSDVLIQGNTVVNAGENSIEVQAFWDTNYYNSDIRIIGNKVYSWGRLASGSGIAVFGRNEGLAILGNTVNGNDSANALRGISITSANFPTETIGSEGSITGNNVTRCVVGIQDTLTNMITVTGNTITLCSGAGTLKGSGSVYFGNKINGTTDHNQFTNVLQIAQPEVLAGNFDGANAPKSNYNLVNNGSFQLFTSGATSFPDYWDDAVGDGSGSTAVSSIGVSAEVPPYGDQAVQIVSAAGGKSLVRQAFTIAQVQVQMLCFTAWVKSSTANSCRIGIRTSAGDFYSGYAATGPGVGFVPVTVAAWCAATDVQASVRLETAANVTAHWSGVSAGMNNYSSFDTDHVTKMVPVITRGSAPTGAHKEGSMCVVYDTGAGTVKLYVYSIGMWRGVTIS